PGRRAGRSGVSGPCAAPGRVVVLTALHCWPPRRRRAGLGLRPDARAFLDGTRRFAQRITPDPGGSALTSGLGGRPLQARRLHVSSHMGPYTHYPQRITPDPGGSALTSGLGGRPLQARRLHVSSHMGPYTHYPPRASCRSDRSALLAPAPETGGSWLAA